MTVSVVDVVLERERSLGVRWEDGRRLDIDLGDLRSLCPCAGGIGIRERGQVVQAPTGLSAMSAELHGNWGLAIRWSDGHETGIYGWEMLRSLTEEEA